MIIHPDAAAELWTEDGEWVRIESKSGRIRQKAKLSTGVDTRVIVVDHAWWFPEREKKESYGWAESNYNRLTSDELRSSAEVDSFNQKNSSQLCCGVAVFVISMTL